MSLAGHNLLQDRVRFVLSVAGVALSLMLILLLGSFLTGIEQQISAYLDHTPGTILVVQPGVTNFTAGVTSVLPPDAAAAVRRTGLATRVVPLLSQFVILDLHGKKQPVHLVGYDPAIGGGPWRLASGRTPSADDEVAFDAELARRHGIALGSQVTITGQAFTVTGLSDGTTSWMTSFIFVRKTAAESLFRTPGATSFLLVTPAAGVPDQAARDGLRAVPGVDARLKTEVVANDRQLYGRVFNPPLRLMIGIAFLVGSLVVGLVIYTATVERQREYGVLKAIGAPSGLLYRLVATQALIATGLGAVAGFGLTLVAARLIMVLRPQFLLTLAPTSVAVALGLALGMALLSALLPARAIALLAPADVFRR